MGLWPPAARDRAGRTARRRGGRSVTGGGREAAGRARHRGALLAWSTVFLRGTPKTQVGRPRGSGRSPAAARRGGNGRVRRRRRAIDPAPSGLLVPARRPSSAERDGPSQAATWPGGAPIASRAQIPYWPRPAALRPGLGERAARARHGIHPNGMKLPVGTQGRITADAARLDGDRLCLSTGTCVTLA